jgi:hypothetical protein
MMYPDKILEYLLRVRLQVDFEEFRDYVFGLESYLLCQVVVVIVVMDGKVEGIT